MFLSCYNEWLVPHKSSITQKIKLIKNDIRIVTSVNLSSKAKFCRRHIFSRVKPVVCLRALESMTPFNEPFWQTGKKQEPTRELPSPLISWVNPFPSRVINRTIFFCNALELHECACCLLSFLYFHWLFPLSARKISPGNRSIYKSTRKRVDSKGLYGRRRLHHLMGSCKKTFFQIVKLRHYLWEICTQP